MKIRFDIQEKYKETELHICTDRYTEEAAALKASLERLLLTRLTVHRDQESRSLGIHEIVRIYSENKRVYVRTGSDTYEVRERLYALEELLKDRDFVRISNSEMVNAALIEKLNMGYTGTIRIIMKNGDETYASRRYVSRIREVLG